jgi:fatty-acyl-CoA synthase
MRFYDYPLIIKQLLINPLRLHPNQEIVYRDLRRLTYREFGTRVMRLGSALQRLGVGFGEVVAVMDWDSHRYLECFFAIPMSGATLMTVNVRLPPEQVLYTLNHAGASTIFCNAEFLALLQALQPHLTAAKRFVLLTDEASPGDEPSAGFPWDGEYESLLEAADPGFVFPDFDERTRATVFYTTGTTGHPKGVFYSHRQIVLHTLGVTATFHHTADDVYMPITPMFHVHAWGNPYSATMCGMKQVYPGRYQPEMLVKLFVQEKVNTSHCVPTILKMFLDAADGIDLSGWKLVIGGSALPKTLAAEMLARGADIYGGYGMSETGPIATVSHVPARLRDGAASELALRCLPGRPVPLCDVRIVDEQMNELPADGQSTGEVVMRAPWLTEAYLDDSAGSEALWRGGWLHTGDIGAMDENGFLHITDRLKDVVKSGGEWVSSLQLEDILMEHPGVAEVAVIGVPDAHWGERPLPVVVKRREADVDAGALITHVKARSASGNISKYAIPDRVEFVDAIPRTSVGKFDKKLLRARFTPTP